MEVITEKKLDFNSEFDRAKKNNSFARHKASLGIMTVVVIFMNIFWNKYWNLVDINIKRYYHLDAGRKLNVHKTFRRHPERHLYVQFTSCVQGDVNLTMIIWYNHDLDITMIICILKIIFIVIWYSKFWSFIILGCPLGLQFRRRYWVSILKDFISRRFAPFGKRATLLKVTLLYEGF